MSKLWGIIEIFCTLIVVVYGLPRWLSVKESSCQCRRHELNPWSGRIHMPRASKPEGRNYQACALEPTSRNYRSLNALEPVLCNKRSHRNEKPEHCN